MSFSTILLAFLKACGFAVALLLLRGAIWLFNMLVIAPLFDPLNRVPGERGTFFQSYLEDVVDPQQSPDTHDKWRKLYGNTFKFQGFGRHDHRLMTFDFRAIGHILNSPVYEKPWQTRSIMARLIGRGIVSMEGHEHKVQRRILGPAFSAGTIKELTPIFHKKAEELCEFWDNALSEMNPSDEQNTPGLDVTSGLGRAVFDAMGLAGFGYAFDSLEDDTRPDTQAYRQMFGVIDQGIAPRDIIDLYMPFLRHLWPSEKTTTIKTSTKDVRQLGCKIIEAKRANILAGETAQKDILSVLVKANLSSDSASRLSDRDLLDQCTTFLFAGTDSVAIGVTWALHQLSTHPAIQTRLFEEVKASLQAKDLDGYESAGSDDSGFVEDPALRGANSQAAWAKSLESLPFLDCVVREALRASPPVHSTIRVATKDDAIPLADSVAIDGHPTNSLRIRKGTYIHIPMEGLNFAEDIWGPDAREFNPDRWSKLPENALAMPGIGGVMSFGYGPHSCLGHRFAIAEMKVFLAALVLRFEFSAVEGVNITKWNSFVTRPHVEDANGNSDSRLPLHIARRL